MIFGAGRKPGRGYTLFWTSVFFAGVLAVCIGLYYASISVNYVWRWYRVPQYFISTVHTPIRAEMQGSVASLEPEGKQTVVVVKDGEDTESYKVPTSSLKVSRGDFISPGDELGFTTSTQPGILLESLWTTLYISVIAIVIGIVIGLLTGLARLSTNPALKYSALTYIELVRGSPLLVQILIWYFVLGTLLNDLLTKSGLPPIPGLWYGIASLAFFAGAYVAEIVRAGIQSIHRGQMEAARSLGMSVFESMRHVILPQAFRRILPPLAGQFISLIKDSSLLGVIAIRELSKATREVVSTSFQPFELYLVCGALYLVLTFALSLLTMHLERRMVQ